MIINKGLPFEFDTPEKLSDDEILEQRRFFKRSELLQNILEYYPDLVFILNEYRQIIGWNKKTEDFFSFGDMELLGKRFGEYINCLHHDNSGGGCGTSKFCKECGAAKAIKFTRENDKRKTEDCSITTIKNGKEESYDLRVTTSKIKLKRGTYILFSAKDISDEKRRHALEKIFFHDVLNTGCAINGLANMIKEEKDESEIKCLSSALVDSSEQLLHEIHSQKDLTFAEKGELEVNLTTTSVNEVLRKVSELYSNHLLMGTNKLDIAYLENDVCFKTDIALLIRSMGNLAKNAIEASEGNEVIKIFIENFENEIIFKVKNDHVIPERIQLQIFKRSFSTKGMKGRGIGTYSVKLLIEQYLGGKVYFVSNKTDRTIFSIKLNK